MGTLIPYPPVWKLNWFRDSIKTTIGTIPHIHLFHNKTANIQEFTIILVKMAHLSRRWSRMLINVTFYIFLIVAINYKVLLNTCWYLSGTSWFEVNKRLPRGIFFPVFFEPWDRPPCSCRGNSEFAAVNLASSKMPNQVVLLIRSISTFLSVKWIQVAIQRN